MQVLLFEGGRRPSRQTQDELKSKGITVISVQKLADCLAALEAAADSSIIIDLDLHRKGIEDIGEIQKAFPDIPIIVVVSMERLAIADEALRQGAWDFVIKQPDLSHLQEIPQALARSAERKHLLAEIERYQEEAERAQKDSQRYREEVKRVQAEIERLEEEAKSLGPQAAGDETLMGITQDLKSPLAAMLGYLEIASTISPDRIEANQLLSIRRVDALARRLFDLVNDHIGALDIEEGRLELQKNLHDINHVIELAVQDKKNEADAKDIAIGVDTGNDLPPIPIDAVQLERAISILISNAISLSPMGGNVAVSSRLEGGTIAVAVKDSGVGLLEEEIPVLFDRKKRVRRRGADVHTVGLYVARHIVNAHGGEIHIQSDPLEGTVLTILLPT